MTTRLDVADDQALLDRTPERRAATRDRFVRRSFLGRTGRLGAMVVAGIAATWIDAPAAKAVYDYCCDLWFPNGPFCGGSPNNGSFTCPAGYTKRLWGCTQPCWVVQCYECTTGPTCWDPTFACSNFLASYRC